MWVRCRGCVLVLTLVAATLAPVAAVAAADPCRRPTIAATGTFTYGTEGDDVIAATSSARASPSRNRVLARAESPSAWAVSTTS